MNNPKVKLFLYFIIGVLSAFLAMYFFNNNKVEKNDTAQQQTAEAVSKKVESVYENSESANENSFDENSIENLTDETLVINYVKAHKQLPAYYITKSEARRNGWNPSQGNLCDAAPGKAIGGDQFSNREKKLPIGNQYFEADVNFSCGQRQADRIVFTKKGEVWLTKDHYRSFQKK